MMDLVALLILALLSTVFPVFRLPAPTGPYAVGTTTMKLDQASSLTMQIWYPAPPSTKGPLASYEPVLGGIRNRLLRQVRTASVRDAVVAKSDRPFPVL